MTNKFVAIRPVVAVFDFDCTITDRHTFWRFLKILVPGRIRYFLIVISIIPSLIALVMKLKTLMEVREVYSKRCMTGIEEDHYWKLGIIFSKESLPQWIKPEAINKLRWHQAEGHRCLLISNSPDVYLNPWGKLMGFDGIACTKFETLNGRLSGKLDGEACQGLEKVKRLKEIIGNLDAYEIFAYGDNESDRHILGVADHAYYRTFS